MRYIDDISTRLREYPWPPYVRRYGPGALLVIAGLLLGMLLFGGQGGDERAHEHTVADHDGVEVWTCSMHPQIRQPEPGQCPICGMDLIPASTTDESSQYDPRFLSVSETAAALMDVQVWPVERRDVEREVRLFGRIDYDETAVRDIVLRAEGQIEQLHVNFENAPVRAGAPLAEIYSPTVQAAARELIQAQLSGDENLIDASREQLETFGLTPGQIDAIAQSGSAPRTFTIYSPTSGIVTELDARQGDWVGSGGRVMRVAGLGQVWAQFEAYESDLANLDVGQLVRFEVEAYPGQPYTGRVAYIDPSFGGDSRTVRVRVNISNPDGRLRPGMFIRGETGATPAQAEVPLVIPASAPLITGERAVVYVRVPGADRPTFEPRDVLLGPKARDYYVVRDGLAEGELVVSNGAFRIDSELQIRGRPSMMSPAVEDEVEVPQAETSSHPVSDPTGQALHRLGQAYLAVAESMLRDDEGAVRDAAQRMEQRIENVDMTGVNPQARQAWQTLSAALLDASREMASAGDVGTRRQALQDLTDHTEVTLRTFESDEIGTYRLAFCPMVHDNEGGTWLQAEEEIANPYFGGEMITCGEIQSEVAPDAPRAQTRSSETSAPSEHVH